MDARNCYFGLMSLQFLMLRDVTNEDYIEGVLASGFPMCLGSTPPEVACPQLIRSDWSANGT
jgi:hypothetical protein